MSRGLRCNHNFAAHGFSGACRRYVAGTKALNRPYLVKPAKKRSRIGHDAADDQGSNLWSLLQSTAPAPSRSASTANGFSPIALGNHLRQAVQRLHTGPLARILQRLASAAGLKQNEIRIEAARWANIALRELAKYPDDVKEPEWVYEKLRGKFENEPTTAINRAVVAAFFRHFAAGTTASAHSAARLIDALSLKRPEAAFPRARAMQRRFVLHVGPTNSGKTHHALEALGRASRGVYAGPLRLLAHEVAHRFNSGNAPGLNGNVRSCNLVTGEEMRISDQNAGLVACTVEMINTTQLYDIAVIDEIQLIHDPSRGYAWTHALLGVRAKEIHLCGEASAVTVVRKILERTGESLDVRYYERLSKLQVENSPLGRSIGSLRSGDCVITFSRRNVFGIKKLIEAGTDLRVGVCYGALPPEVRESQAQAFNCGELDVLVATDAVGMGLNLSIRRIVFERIAKFDGTSRSIQLLAAHQIKQIAGRAGRFGLKRDTTPSTPDIDLSQSNDRAAGFVVGVQPKDHIYITDALATDTIPLDRACLKLPFEQLHRIYEHCSWSCEWIDLMALAMLLAPSKEPYRLPISLKEVERAQHISSIPGLTLRERDQFTSAPIPARSAPAMKSLRHFAKCKTTVEPVDIDSWAQEQGISPAIDAGSQHPYSIDDEGLIRLEEAARTLGLYSWLNYREPLTYPKREAVARLSQRCNDVLSAVLSARRNGQHLC